MRVLIIKTSSLGDVIHTLPAVTDAAHAIEEIQIDWVVEEKIADIVRWHSHVDRVIPVALRRWRKALFSKKTRKEWRVFKETVRKEEYDIVIDAQGLLKSAWLTWIVKGKRCGWDWSSARESFASIFYQHKANASWDVHAVTRARMLFSQALGYALPETLPNYALDKQKLTSNSSAHSAPARKYLLFFHGTTWENKHWPETYWCALAKRAIAAGWHVKLSWGTSAEHARAERIAKACSGAEVLPFLNLQGLAVEIAAASAVVAVDTGLGHLSCALDVPTIALFGPTDPERNGILGLHQVNLSATFECAPCLQRECTYKGKSEVFPACFQTISPELVWEKVLEQVDTHHNASNGDNH